MELTTEENERYNRQIIIENFGKTNQLKLKNAKVLVIGAGGLGCPVIQYLVASGIGQIGIVDADSVSLSNLQRQILFTEDEIGFSKAEIAANKMNKLNSLVQIQMFNEFLDEKLADILFPKYDVVVGCTDSFHTRYLIDTKSQKFGIPFVHGAINEFEGQLTIFNYNGSSSYANLFGNQPQELSKPRGVIGAISGIIGSLMALEVIKIITATGTVHSNKLLLYNGLKNAFTQISIV